jgi:alkaline phosphatase D
VYEYGAEYPSDVEAVRPINSPMHEAVSLADYRLRYALYHTDSDLQALTASAPLIAAWDDHESANNPWVDGAQNHNGGEGNWNDRKIASVRAYHEWMPTRSYNPEFIGPRIYRYFQFGDLATLIMSETRLTSRTNPNEVPRVSTTVKNILQGATPDRWSDPDITFSLTELHSWIDSYTWFSNKTILGETQLAWLSDATQASKERGSKWQLYGQQIMVQDVNSPDFELAIERQTDTEIAHLWQESLENTTTRIDGTFEYHDHTDYRLPLLGKRASVDELWNPEYPDSVRDLALSARAMGHFHIQGHFDSWAAYKYERDKFLTVLSQANNAIVYAGDSHVGWAANLRKDGQIIAAEFDGTSVSSPGIDTFLGFLPLEFVEAAYLAANPEMTYMNTKDHGYMLVQLTHEKHRVQFITIGRQANDSAICGVEFVTTPTPETMETLPGPCDQIL